MQEDEQAPSESSERASTDAPAVEKSTGDSRPRRPMRDARLQLRLSSELKERMRGYAERRHNPASFRGVQTHPTHANQTPTEGGFLPLQTLLSSSGDVRELFFERRVPLLYESLAVSAPVFEWS